MDRANSNNSIKSKIKNHPEKPKYPKNEKLAGRDHFFAEDEIFAQDIFIQDKKNPKTKNQKMENLPKTKKNKTGSLFYSISSLCLIRPPQPPL